MEEVMQRFHALKRSEDALGLYALVDGLQFEEFTGQRLCHEPGLNRPILLGTEDEALARAGPWLVDVVRAAARVPELQALERALPSVSWLITAIDLEGLAQLLQLRLEAELPDGRRALLRFYDPRVLANLVRTMSGAQRLDFFQLIGEWHFLHEGEHIVIRGGHA